jgi:nucleoside-diphosphate-sugar epimerase
LGGTGTGNNIPLKAMVKASSVVGVLAVALGLLFSWQQYQQRMAMMQPLPRVRKWGEGGRRAIVIGATGATGRHVVRQLLDSPEWMQVSVIVRRDQKLTTEKDSKTRWKGLALKATISEAKKKLTQIEVPDFDNLEAATKGKWVNHDVVFNCLGTTRAQAGGPDGFKKIEADYSYTVSRLARQEGVPHISVVSAVGANHKQYAVDWIHPLLYIR